MFQTPQHLDEVLDAVLRELPRAVRGLKQSVVNDGSAHLVVLLEDQAAVRIARDSHAATKLQQRQSLVDRLPKYSFHVPRSLTPVKTVGESSAVAVEFSAGTVAPQKVDPTELQRLLRQLWDTDTSALEPFLAQQLEFCGGAQWKEQLDKAVTQYIESALRAKAHQIIDELAAALESTAEPVFAHGDLAGHNLRWQNGSLTGVIDWDLASKSSRAADVACLAAWHDFEVVAEAVQDRSLIAEARSIFNSFRLQQLAFLTLNDRTSGEIERSIEQNHAFLQRL